MENNKETPHKGRKPSGKTRQEIVNASKKRQRAALKLEGKKPLNVYVSGEVVPVLDVLKKQMDFRTRGEVIEMLVEAEKVRRKIVL